MTGKQRKYKCIKCGTILTIRKIHKYNREHHYALGYTPPCFKCGCNEFEEELEK